MRDQAGCVEHYAAVSNGGSFDLAQHNNTHQFVVADGVGKGLGRIKNVRRSWRKMKAKLSDPLVDTSVTFAQYEALDQDGKLEKKRAPGSWTPSRYKSNRRAIADLREKTLIVYDLDYIARDQLDEIRVGLAPISKYAWFMHTTRSHCPESPRARMILPVSRPMKPDEAHAVFRILAQELADDPEEGIEIPDLVSFRGNQTMFWPSRSKDQEFWTDENVGEIVDVDAVLASYPGWEDYTNLPYQAEENSHGITDPNKRMEDPHKKQEPIGAWCRSYTVQEVIENWLTDIYAPGDSETEERYTYLLGTGSNGAVVYEDGEFLHSNHGSDPVETANAFDLCRIHMFGHLDTDARANTLPGNMPSFKAMVKFAQNDERVISELNSHMDDLLDDLQNEDDADDKGAPERKESKDAPERKPDYDDLDDLLGGDPDDDSDDPVSMLDDLPGEDDDGDEKPTKEKKHAWMKHLRRKANGELDGAAVSNITLILENDPRFKGVLGYNEFTNEPVCFKPIRSPKINLPSRKVERRDRRCGREWQDSDDQAIKILCSADAARHGYETDFSRENSESGVLAASSNNLFHPVQDMFEAAHKKYVASGRASKGAIETVPQRYLGCPDDMFHRQTSRNLLIALAARTFEPGCKFDTVTIIRGSQGGGKSTMWRILSGDFFTELPKDFSRTDKMVEAMKETLIAEMGEMAGLRRETVEDAKEFITRQMDKVRLAYARRPKKLKRTTVLTGTSNLDSILHGPTGNRRFWIWVDIHSERNPIDLEGLRDEVEMLWGEAYDEYFKMRKAQPEGDLHLDLKGKEARDIRDRLADAHRALTVPEKLADHIQEWLGDPRDPDQILGIEDPAELGLEEGDLVVPQMFCRHQVVEAFQNHPEVRKFRDASETAYGKALGLLVDRGVLDKHPKCRRHGLNREWFTRKGGTVDDPMWSKAPADDGSSDHDIDDMLG